MPEVTALIPYFIENLGNSKVSCGNLFCFAYLVKPFLIGVTKIVWATIFTFLYLLFLLHILNQIAFIRLFWSAKTALTFNHQLIIN